MANIFTTIFGKAKPATPSAPKTINPDLKDGDVYSPTAFNMYQDVGNLRGLGQESDVIKQLNRYDPDAANAIWATLRFASTPLNIIYKDDKGEFNADKTKEFKNLLKANWLISTNDPSAEELSDMIMRQLFLYGGTGLEVVLNEFKFPTKFVLVKNSSVEWRMKKGKFIPFQKKPGGSGEINLEIPTFFFQTLDRDPDEATGESPLLPAIQAIVFKQQVIGDIQRVLKRTGYPRLKVTVLEEVLRKNAPMAVKGDDKKLSTWLADQKTAIGTELGKINPEDAVVIFDSLEIDTLENKNASSVDFRPIMEILDSQVVSALKSLPSILGKGKGGSQNIASVESMVFLNTPRYLQTRATKLLSQAYTMAARLAGMKGFIEVSHEHINLRPDLELEPQRLAKQNRILQLQSFGHIDDSEAALALGIEHLPVNELTGTLFLTGGPEVDVENISPNTDPLGRSITGGAGSGDTVGNESPS